MTVRRPMRASEGQIARIDDMIHDPRWVLEQKMDGTRVLFVLTPSSVEAYGSGGGRLMHSAATQWLPAITPVLHQMMIGHLQDTEVVLDGELMIGTGQLWVFDVPYLRLDGHTFIEPSHELHLRRAVLEGVFDTGIFGSTCVSLIRQAKIGSAKQALWDRVRAQGAEGVVAKHVDGTYALGRRSDKMLKLKIIHTADVVVQEVIRPDPAHGSIRFVVYDDDMNVALTGSCSAIGKPAVNVGDAIEVAYLFRDPKGGSLVQPRMTRVRHDKEPWECTMDQFTDYTREAL